ncbi:GspH/FimT family pseudopilin [Shewanella litorisediminis]|uniref:Type II secretion system protein H n=1 Tax=Shewanella litorisediminis TaxID=1173586 RepID=A0ABX7G5Y0_9GAMM|nr:GspH/FimT family pseudopilin [Shewanella litorisediminis]MCL2917552.1 GspH/FimT family pseudopilin [Shewanella litorisediminis]QRH02679.1 GspH/FimT family pseudopilin [Shewanella litorisediminis]
MKHQNGFTLIELMITIAIVTILLTIGVPQLTELHQAYRADSAIKVIQQTLQYARNTAISYGLRVTVCPLKDNQCTNDWHLGLAVFTDSGISNQIDGSDKLLMQTGSFDSSDFMFYNRAAARFQPDGLASGSNGTFKYCPGSADSPYSKAVIINQAGRVRISTEKNIDCTQ